MKLIKTLLQHKLEREEMFARAGRRQFSYEEHVSCYLMSLAYLGVDDKDINIKQALWKKFVSTIEDEKLTKLFKQLLQNKTQQDILIVKALNEIEEQKDSDLNIGFGSLYRPFTWGVLSYDFEAE